VEMHRGRVKLVPRQKSLQAWFIDFIAKIRFRVHAWHVIDEVFFGVVLIDVKSCPWHFGGRLICLCKLIKEGSFTSIGKAY